jgi:hypothetical protein
VEQDFPQPLAQFRAAGVTARHDVVPPLAEPVDKQRHLGGFSDAIDTVKTEKHGFKS